MTRLFSRIILTTWYSTRSLCYSRIANGYTAEISGGGGIIKYLELNKLTGNYITSRGEKIEYVQTCKLIHNHRIVLQRKKTKKGDCKIVNVEVLQV